MTCLWRSGMALSVLLLIAACGSPPEDSVPQSRVERIESMYAEYERKFEDIESITVDDYLALLETEQEPVLVDVREPEERAVSMIPGAMAMREFERRQDEFEGRMIVTYCTVGYRSGLYAEVLHDLGWEVRNLEGSILAWTHAGRDLVADGEPVRRLHVYGRRWDLAAPGYETVW